MIFRSVVDVCFCLLQQLQRFMTLLRYLSHWNLKADRLMISTLMAGFHFSDLKIITGRAHTPLCAFMMLFMTEISCRHQLFLTDWLSCVFFSFVVLLESATATCQWSAEFITGNENLLHPRCFTQKPFSSFLSVCFAYSTVYRFSWISQYYFCIVALLHKVLMITHETEPLPKDGSAINAVLHLKYLQPLLYT